MIILLILMLLVYYPYIKSGLYILIIDVFKIIFSIIKLIKRYGKRKNELQRKAKLVQSE